MSLAESYIKFSIEYILKNNIVNVNYINNNYSKSLLDTLNSILIFKRISYSDVIDILLTTSKSKKNFFNRCSFQRAYFYF